MINSKTFKIDNRNVDYAGLQYNVKFDGKFKHLYLDDGYLKCFCNNGFQGTLNRLSPNVCQRRLI